MVAPGLIQPVRLVKVLTIGQLINTLLIDSRVMDVLLIGTVLRVPTGLLTTTARSLE